MSSDWQARWEVQRELGAGGQGATLLVKSKEAPYSLAVVKTLLPHKRREDKARRRMNLEVAALQGVADTAPKVPRVLESNTHRFSDLGTELYFVMEHVSGDALSKVIDARGKLPPQVAIPLAIDLCETMKACHLKDVMHRDIKPDNIIVRSLERADVVVVDYGLSFNEAARGSTDLTSGNEGIGNAFSDLPERRTPSAQRRYESDLTGVCGVLYYCLTGQWPRPFRDAHNKPPHRSSEEGKSISSVLPNYPALRKLQAIFDKAFENDIAYRFSAADQLLERLHDLISSQSTQTRKKVDDILRSGSEQLLRASRQAQIEKFKEVVGGAIGIIHEAVNVHVQNSEFRCYFNPTGQHDEPLPSGITNLDIGGELVVQAIKLGENRRIRYMFGVEGNQSVLLRRRSNRIHGLATSAIREPTGGGFLGGFSFAHTDPDLQPIEEWQTRIWFPANELPNRDDVRAEIEADIEWAVEEIIEFLRDK